MELTERVWAPGSQLQRRRPKKSFACIENSTLQFIQ